MCLYTLKEIDFFFIKKPTYVLEEPIVPPEIYVRTPRNITLVPLGTYVAALYTSGALQRPKVLPYK